MSIQKSCKYVQIACKCVNGGTRFVIVAYILYGWSWPLNERNDCKTIITFKVQSKKMVMTSGLLVKNICSNRVQVFIDILKHQTFVKTSFIGETLISKLVEG